MIYDRGPLTVYQRDGKPVENRLAPVSCHYYAELEVYHRRFFESVQAGDRVDILLQVPEGEALRAALFAVPEDGAVYRVVQAQHTEDDDGHPACRLSLHREERNYDIVGTGSGA